MLNTKDQLVVYIDYKLFVEFLSTEYYKNIFKFQANKLHLLNIRIQHIPEEKI